MIYTIYEIGKRDINEDSYRVLENVRIKVYLVADGCGGHASGDVASKLAVDFISKAFAENNTDISVDSIGEVLESCNKAIIYKQKEYGSMRTTIVGLIQRDKDVYAFNIGDSRLYQIREGQVVFKTEDHAVPFVLYKAGIITEEEINTHEDRNKLLQALGIKEDLKYKVYKLDALPGDLFLLATDGFWEHMYTNDFIECNDDNAERWIMDVKQKIIEKNDPEQDNYTALLIGGING